MKHASHYIGLLLLCVILFIGACGGESDCDSLQSENSALSTENARLASELQTSQSQLNSLKDDFNLLKDGFDLLKSEYLNLQQQERVSYEEEYYDALDQANALGTDLKAAENDIKELESKYQALLESSQQSALRNPTWSELEAFLLQDTTDAIAYVADEFDCSGFAITLRDNASRQGFRCAFVSIGFGEGAIGHALNAFETTDKGLIYVDNTERDAIAYLQTGKIYGVIVLDGVKEQFIDCQMSPEDFWKPLSYTRYSGSIFGYEYYENYSQRSQFYLSTVDAYNNDVNAYNTAVKSFNQGDRAYSYDQIQDWSAKLNDWSSNLDALKSDLGSSQVNPMSIVSNIETYWN